MVHDCFTWFYIVRFYSSTNKNPIFAINEKLKSLLSLQYHEIFQVLPIISCVFTTVYDTHRVGIFDLPYQPE